jgi:hypothetical protein
MWLDDYERPARLVPGLLATAPIAIALIGFGVRDNTLHAGVSSLMIAVGAPLVLAKHVRERGLGTQRKLYREWGGAPTTLLLRTPTTGPIGPIQQQRRTNVERVTRVALPREPTTADSTRDEAYQAAVLTLRKKTTDHGAFPLVFAENKNYGFERNCLGVRPEGIAISSLSLVALLVGMFLAVRGAVDLSLPVLAVAAVCDVAVLAFWLAWPTKDRVKRAGTRYAERLLDASADL